MNPDIVKQNLLKDDKKLLKFKGSSFKIPEYNPQTYYKDITCSNYFHTLLILRHYIELFTDIYFGIKLNAKKVDLFMMTPSISSPIAPGSDSKPIPIKLGKLKMFLTDSSQFGFEPILLINGINQVYCYLPSMRGEAPDYRHLNQFFQCETEIIGTLDELIPIAEGYIKQLCEAILLMKNVVRRISSDPVKTRKVLKKIIKISKFPQITFDEAVNILTKESNREKYIVWHKNGKDITAKGELFLMKKMNLEIPIWIKYFDRDRVPFYQKPYPKDKRKTINADLLFPPLVKNAFGGEILGSGQRQDKPLEMHESLKRQRISPKPYEWYINLRSQPNYKITSGFGLGIERFIAWALARKNIRDVILYPRLKNAQLHP